MKEFDYELDKYGMLDNRCCRGTAEHFWKAALEWVMSRQGFGVDHGSAALKFYSIISDIERELDE